MGRIFETRKATMFKRWDRMAKQFARIGKDITIAVKAAGPTPENNPALRRIIQNARALNMPLDKVDAARVYRPAGEGELFQDQPPVQGTFIVFPTLRPFRDPPPLPSLRLSASETRTILGPDASNPVSNASTTSPSRSTTTPARRAGEILIPRT